MRTVMLLTSLQIKMQNNTATIVICAASVL